MKNYCAKCNKLSEVNIKTILESFSVKGEKIDITAEVAVCNDCGAEVFNQDLDEKNLSLAYSIYRKNHNLLSPTEIANIRKKYLLSQRALSLLLEWGEVTIHRYESGSIQDPAHNEVLILIDDPRNMKELFEKNNQFLNTSIRERLRKKIDELMGSDIKPKFRISLDEFLSSEQIANEFSGFATFNLDKMINMIVYIAGKTNGVFTTKLNKLLFYADFLNFKRTLVSISGSTYVHLPLGPVPNDYEWIIAAAKAEGLLSEEEIIFTKGNVGAQYKALASADMSLFKNEEVAVINFVLNYFKDYNCVEIKGQSHQEKGYVETQPNEKISYKFASSLSIA